MPGCCNPCPSVEKDTPQPTGPCPCCTCCCGKKPVISPCYKQPKVPESYAPRRCYQRPSAAVEQCTTYKMSYLPNCPAGLRECFRPTPNIVASRAPFESETIQRMSYQPNPCCVTNAIRPCHHDMWGKGPMQNITTQRHDFVPKPCTQRESFKPAPKYHSIETPFENKTINRLSYLDPGRVPLPVSYKPTRCYEKPAAKMEASTIHKMSYQPVCAQTPQRPPWACKGQYQRPCAPVEQTTIYKASFLPPGEDCSTATDPCSYGDCNPCACVCPSQCIEKDPCACHYPVAAC